MPSPTYLLRYAPRCWLVRHPASMPLNFCTTRTFPAGGACPPSLTSAIRVCPEYILPMRRALTSSGSGTLYRACSTACCRSRTLSCSPPAAQAYAHVARGRKLGCSPNASWSKIPGAPEVGAPNRLCTVWSNADPPAANTSGERIGVLAPGLHTCVPESLRYNIAREDLPCCRDAAHRRSPRRKMRSLHTGPIVIACSSAQALRAPHPDSKPGQML